MDPANTWCLHLRGTSFRASFCNSTRPSIIGCMSSSCSSVTHWLSISDGHCHGVIQHLYELCHRGLCLANSIPCVGSVSNTASATAHGSREHDRATKERLGARAGAFRSSDEKSSWHPIWAPPPPLALFYHLIGFLVDMIFFLHMANGKVVFWFTKGMEISKSP